MKPWLLPADMNGTDTVVQQKRKNLHIIQQKSWIRLNFFHNATGQLTKREFKHIFQKVFRIFSDKYDLKHNAFLQC